MTPTQASAAQFFLTDRTTAIATADRLRNRGHALVALHRVNPRIAPLQLGKAAMFYRAAALAYARADLGLRAQQSADAANACLAGISDRVGGRTCR